MAVAHSDKAPLRLFATLKGDALPAAPAATATPCTPPTAAAPAAWLAARHDLATTSLLLQCIAHGWAGGSSGPLPNFGSSEGGDAEGSVLAAAFAQRVVPAYWWATRLNPLLWRWSAAVRRRGGWGRLLWAWHSSCQRSSAGPSTNSAPSPP